MLYDAPEELKERLMSAEVVDNDVMEHLWGQHNALRDAGQSSPPVSQFFIEGHDLSSFQAARAWWPRAADLPARLGFPGMLIFLHSYEQGPSFAERLTERAMPVVKWLESQGVDVSNPNETVADRKARQNREAQARFRARRSGKDDHAEATAQAYKAYLDACARRKAAAAALDEEVKSFYDAWQALKNKASE